MGRASTDGNGDGRVASAADLKRAEIVRLAAELFDENGYYRTSVDDIADAAGIRKPTLYHYFSGKQEILFWIYQEYSELAVRRQEERLERGVDPATGLLDLMRDVVGLLESHPAHARVFFEYQREIPDEYQRQIKDQRRRYQDSVGEMLRQGIASGAFREVDVELTANAIFGMINWAYQWYKRGGRWDSREVADAFHDLLIGGIGAGAAGTGAVLPGSDGRAGPDVPLPAGS